MDLTPDQQRAMRARLMELHGAVKAYFEATMVGSSGGFVSAFDALRKNQHMAEAFVTDLQALMEYLERELLPALSPSNRSAPPILRQQLANPTPAPAPKINDDETMLLNRMPANVQQELARFAKDAVERAAPKQPASPLLAPPKVQEPKVQSKIELDDGDESLIQEMVFDSEDEAAAPKKAEPKQETKLAPKPALKPETKPVLRPEAKAEQKPGGSARTTSGSPLAARLAASTPSQGGTQRPLLGKAGPLDSRPTVKESIVEAKPEPKVETKPVTKMDPKSTASAPRPVASGLAARMAAVAPAKSEAKADSKPIRPSTLAVPTSDRPMVTSKPEDPTGKKNNPEPWPAGKTDLPGARSAPPQIVSPAAPPISVAPQKSPKPSTPKRTTPLFDESDVTNPGFTIDADFSPPKRR